VPFPAPCFTAAAACSSAARIAALLPLPASMRKSAASLPAVRPAMASIAGCCAAVAVLVANAVPLLLLPAANNIVAAAAYSAQGLCSSL
jgi:hypothetical protein